MKKQPLKPYLILTAILYGHFLWLRRHPGGELTIPVKKMCSHFSTTPRDLRKSLELLYNLGMLEYLEWNSHWAHTRANMPIGMTHSPSLFGEEEEGSEEEDIMALETFLEHAAVHAMDGEE